MAGCPCATESGRITPIESDVEAVPKCPWRVSEYVWYVLTYIHGLRKKKKRLSQSFEKYACDLYIARFHTADAIGYYFEEDIIPHARDTLECNIRNRWVSPITNIKFECTFRSAVYGFMKRQLRKSCRLGTNCMRIAISRPPFPIFATNSTLFQQIVSYGGLKKKKNKKEERQN